MKKIISLLCCLSGITCSNAQITIKIDAGTDVVMGATLNMTYGNFVNNGMYMDTSGTFIANGTTFGGSGTTTVNDLNYFSGSSVNNLVVSVYNTATIEPSASVDANSNLYLRSDLKSNANIINNGEIFNDINGLIVHASPNIGTGSPYTSHLALNISGTEMKYQWQSSADTLTWSDIGGGTDASYTAVVTGDTYYRAELTTANTSYHQFSSAIKLTLNANDEAVVSATHADELKVFPNPGKTDFTFNGSLGITDDTEVTIEIVSITGSVIYRSKSMTHNGGISEHIALNKTTCNGSYLMNIHGGGVNKAFHIVVLQ